MSSPAAIKVPFSGKQQINIILLIGLVALLISTVQGRPSAESSFKSCGNALTSRISVICGGVYNSFPSSVLTTDRHHHRVRRGIVDDCCKRPCSNSMLREYCRAETEEEDSLDYEEEQRLLDAKIIKFEEIFSSATEASLVEAAMASKSKVEIGRVGKDYQNPWTWSFQTRT